MQASVRSPPSLRVANARYVPPAPDTSFNYLTTPIGLSASL